MDVHPPDRPIHTWRDFFIHIATIVVGLLIAIGLEQTVEAVHHHLVRLRAERNLEIELEQNRATLREDERQLAISRAQLSAMAEQIASARSGGQSAELKWPRWNWSDFVSAAWDTARSSEATALMPLDEVQQYDGVYLQEAIVNEQASVFIGDIYRVDGPELMGRRLSQLSPEELTALGDNVERATADIAHLMDLCASLERVYQNAPRS